MPARSPVRVGSSTTGSRSVPKTNVPPVRAECVPAPADVDITTARAAASRRTSARRDPDEAVADGDPARPRTYPDARDDAVLVGIDAHNRTRAGVRNPDRHLAHR